MLKTLMTKQDNPFVTWQKEMNKLFDKFSRDLDVSQFSDEGFEPRVELKDANNQYILKAEVPGIAEKDIRLTMNNNCLIIEGERESEKETETKGVYRSEFHYGSFYRAIPFEDEVDEENVKATYKNGILTVQLRKKGNHKHHEKSIPITLS